jgi:hypothetical protein
MVWKKLDETKINSFLQTEDIEGFIELGAPNDEYESEAKDIAQNLTKLNLKELSFETILEVLSTIWTKNFNLNEEDLEKRQEALDKIARQIFFNFKTN